MNSEQRIEQKKCALRLMEIDLFTFFYDDFGVCGKNSKRMKEAEIKSITNLIENVKCIKLV